MEEKLSEALISKMSFRSAKSAEQQLPQVPRSPITSPLLKKVVSYSNYHIQSEAEEKMALLMSPSSLLGHTERKFLFLFVRHERLLLKKKKIKHLKKIPPKDITAHKISSSFLEHLFYYTRRPFY